MVDNTVNILAVFWFKHIFAIKHIVCIIIYNIRVHIRFTMIQELGRKLIESVPSILTFTPPTIQAGNIILKRSITQSNTQYVFTESPYSAQGKYVECLCQSIKNIDVLHYWRPIYPTHFYYKQSQKLNIRICLQCFFRYIENS